MKSYLVASLLLGSLSPGVWAECCVSMTGTCPEGYAPDMILGGVAVCGQGGGCVMGNIDNTPEGVVFGDPKPPDCDDGASGAGGGVGGPGANGCIPGMEW